MRFFCRSWPTFFEVLELLSTIGFLLFAFSLLLTTCYKLSIIHQRIWLARNNSPGLL